MVKCQYPNCHHPALYIPVVELPTIRTGGETTEMVQTKEPTVLMFREVCQEHRDSYDLLDWVAKADWAYIQEAARTYGLNIPMPHLMVILFKPLGWTPKRGLEIERHM